MEARLKALLITGKKLEKNLNLQKIFPEKIKELSKNIFELRKNAGNLAKSLSKKREQAAKLVKKGIEETLKELGIQEPQFKTQIKINQAEKDSGVFIDGKYY